MPGILVVEDDENLNRGIAFSLKKSGYEVFSAESVKKAKRIASDNNVDVTICDVNLPDGNGLEFVRWMRCNYNTYIICLTALDQEMDQVMGYEAGADDYITKPFSLSVLLLKIVPRHPRGLYHAEQPQGGRREALLRLDLIGQGRSPLLRPDGPPRIPHHHVGLRFVFPCAVARCRGRRTGVADHV